MNRMEVFLLIIILTVIISLSVQTVSTRVQYKNSLTITVEYFPIRLILYNFRKKKKKTKLKKRIKQFRFFLIPTLNATRFLLKHSDTKVFSLQLSSLNFEEPHQIFLFFKLENLGIDYILATLFSLSKNLSVISDDYDISDTPLDLEFSVKLYTVPLAFFVLIFSVLKNIGRKKKFV